jgi:hypothetical protein
VSVSLLGVNGIDRCNKDKIETEAKKLNARTASNDNVPYSAMKIAA